MLKLGVNGAVESNVLHSSVNTSVNAKVNADDGCEYIFSLFCQKPTWNNEKCSQRNAIEQYNMNILN